MERVLDMAFSIRDIVRCTRYGAVYVYPPIYIVQIWQKSTVVDLNQVPGTEVQEVTFIAS